MSKASDDAAALAESLTAEGDDVEAGLKRFEAARLDENHRIIQHARHLGAYLQATRNAEEQARAGRHSTDGGGDRGNRGAGFSVCLARARLFLQY